MPEIMKKLFTTIIGVAACTVLPILANAQVNSVMLKASGTNIGYYTSIQNAYNAIPATLTQPYELELQDNYNGANETLPVTFINKAGASAANTITVINTGNAPLVLNCNLASTDCFVFDGADWVTINSTIPSLMSYPTFRVNGTGTAQSHYAILMKNGATNNTVSNLELRGLQTGSGSTVYIGTGGNINNTIKNNIIQGPTAITSEGTVGNTNANLIIRSNYISSYAKAGILLNQGVGKVHIDSNSIAHMGLYPQTEGYGILHQVLNDSLFITRNAIFFSTKKLNATTRGIELIVGGTPAPGGVYSSVTNNMLFSDGGSTEVVGDTMYHTADSMSNLIGISYVGSGVIHADIVNNTVKLSGNMDGISILNAYSVAFKNNIGNASSQFRIGNNIFVNERTTGSAASENIVVVYVSPANIVYSDYNTYNSAPGGIFAKIGSTNYASLATFRTAIGSVHEVQSNTYPVSFMDEYDLHLTRTALGNINLGGTSLGLINRDDIDGQFRSGYTRGADEYVPICNGVSTSSSLSPTGSQTICMDDYIDVSAALDIPRVNGVVFQWQSRPAGSSVPFTNITTVSGSQTRLIIKPASNTEYRLVDSCLSGPGAGISDTLSVIVNPKPDITGINETHFGLDYDFSAFGNVADINPLTYHWDFGDGFTSGTDSPNHVYAADGTYEVELYVVGLCGTDTFRTTFNATVSVGNVQTGKLSVYPNPATGRFMLECTNLPVGEQVNITVTGMLGSNVYRQSFRNTSTKLQRDVDVSGFAPGVYNVELRSGTQVYRGNIVLQ